LEVLYYLLPIPFHSHFLKKENVRKLEGEDHPEDVCVNMRVIFKDAGFEDVDWIHLAQSRAQWWTVMNTVMNLYVI
jgi:hypothetical protein